MATVTAEVDVDLDDFEDDEIAAEYEARGLGEDYADSSDGETVAQIRRLLAKNNTREAFILIERLFAPVSKVSREIFEKALKSRDPASGRPLIL